MLSHFNVVANICQQVYGPPEIRICDEATGRTSSTKQYIVVYCCKLNNAWVYDELAVLEIQVQTPLKLQCCLRCVLLNGTWFVVSPWPLYIYNIKWVVNPGKGVVKNIAPNPTVSPTCPKFYNPQNQNHNTRTPPRRPSVTPRHYPWNTLTWPTVPLPIPTPTHPITIRAKWYCYWYLRNTALWELNKTTIC